MTWTFRDGTFGPGADVPVTDRGFRYGMSVFETVAVWRGKTLFWPEHRDRLGRAAAAAGIDLPALPDLPAPGKKTGILRVYVTAGDGSPLAPATHPRIVALFEEQTVPTEAERAAGWRVGLSRAPVAPVLGGWKTGCYWPHVQALAEARREGWDEILVVNPAGAIISAAMANVFFVTGGRVVTPPCRDGARDGVLRAWVAGKLGVEEQPVAPDFVAEECFLTNSRIGVLPVREWDGRVFPARATGDWLAGLYHAEVLR